MRLVVLSLVAVTLIGIAATAALAFVPPETIRYTVLGTAAAACIAIAVIACVRAGKLADEVDRKVDEAGSQARAQLAENARQTQQWIDALRRNIEQNNKELPDLVEQLRSGHQPAPRWPTTEPATTNPFELLAHELRQAQSAVEFTLVRMQQDPSSRTDPGVAVFANLARRVQSLAHRAIQRLDELEQMVEDPDLLKGLFAVDHLVTGVRRQAESLAVLGGSMPRRQWSKPVAMYTVLRSAVAEVEHYARVKVIPPVDGTLHGHAVADVIHLIAELVENATSFSEPDTQVTLNTQRVTAGLAIDIRDRGLGMPQQDRMTLNKLLSNPEEADREAQLRDGRIGLYVVAQLAHRHQIGVELANNMYGGTDAHVVIPASLLGATEDEAHEQAAANNAESVLTTVEPTGTNGAPDPATTQLTGAEGTYRAPVADREPQRSNGTAQQVPAAPAPQPADNPTGYGRHSGDLLPTEPPQQAPAAEPAHGGPAVSNEERPALPRRDRTRSYLVPQLASGAAPAEEKPRGGPNPGLWASYRSGVEGGTKDQEPGGREN
ncbi:sensor histidine kinase [Saccharopolyspora griseoalba]|uniref:histidine kinase n=1 Tax=Saccharopolyspora griseoalba TaxID=1431848 RepID=A0ABW2LQ04_9PSEU